MRRHFLAVVIAAILPLVLSGGSTIAQEGTPPAEPRQIVLPEGVTAEPLAVGIASTLPAAPAMMELIRFTLAPGAGVQLPSESPSTALVYVEAGTMTARIEAPVTVTRATVDGEQEAVAAGIEFTAETGDSFVGPAFVGVEARNTGTAPLVLLMAVIEPAA